MTKPTHKSSSATLLSHQSPSVGKISQRLLTPPTTERLVSPIRRQSHKYTSSRSPLDSPAHSSPTSINSFLSTETRFSEDLSVEQEDISMAKCTEPPFDINASTSTDYSPFNFLSFENPFQDSLSRTNSLVSDVDADHARNLAFFPAQPDSDASRLSFSQLLEDENDEIEEMIRMSDL